MGTGGMEEAQEGRMTPKTVRKRRHSLRTVFFERCERRDSPNGRSPKAYETAVMRTAKIRAASDFTVAAGELSAEGGDSNALKAAA